MTLWIDAAYMAKTVTTMDELIRLSDPDDAGELNLLAVADAIAAAQSMAESALKPQYQDIIDPPEVLRRVVANIALYHLYERQPRIDDIVMLRYQNSVSILRKIGNGEMALEINQSAAKFVASGVRYQSAPRVMNGLRGYM